MSAYYNEVDPKAAAWLRELIRRGLIAPGEVDERDIREVRASDVAGFRQVHWFAGIGTWSYALRCAGWGDEREVWTGSCPCQPFSSAGKQRGVEDERHLWPVWFRLIAECRPGVLFGEQVASAIRSGWLDALQTDLEGRGYAVWPVVLPACGFGAPHKRSRLYFVADAGEPGQPRGVSEAHEGREGSDERGEVSLMGDTESHRWERRSDDGDGGRREPASGQGCSTGGSCELGDADGAGLEGRGLHEVDGVGEDRGERAARAPGPVGGFWRDAEWIPCRDGKARPVEPGTFPLAHGAPARVVRLRGYGNAICSPVAEAFIRSYMEACDVR